MNSRDFDGATDELIRWALRDTVAGEEPSPRVWRSIRARLSVAGEPVVRRRERRLLFGLSPVAQVLVVGLLVVACGVRLQQGVEVWQGEHPAKTALVTEQATGERFFVEEDLLEGRQFYRTVELERMDYATAKAARLISEATDLPAGDIR